LKVEGGGFPGESERIGFAAGLVRTIQDGAATQIQLDANSGPGQHWVTLATIQNVAATSLTTDNWRWV